MFSDATERLLAAAIFLGVGLLFAFFSPNFTVGEMNLSPKATSGQVAKLPTP